VKDGEMKDRRRYCSSRKSSFSCFSLSLLEPFFSTFVLPSSVSISHLLSSSCH
jgi:hypothetical protein